MKLFICMLCVAFCAVVNSKQHAKWQWKDVTEEEDPVVPPFGGSEGENVFPGVLPKDTTGPAEEDIPPAPVKHMHDHHRHHQHGKHHHDNDGTPQETTTPAPHKKKTHWKKYKPVNVAKDTPAKKAWKKITNESPSDTDSCDLVECKKKDICLVNAETNAAECVPKKFLRQGKKMRRAHKNAEKKIKHVQVMMKKQKHRDDQLKEEEIKRLNKKHDAAKLEKELHKKSKKDGAHHYQKLHDKRQKHKLHHMKAAMSQRSKKQRDLLDEQNISEDEPKVCTSVELEDMGRRLLDWFKLLQDEAHTTRTQHLIEKRNSMKKELHEEGECICQAPVSWEFLKMDKDADGSLSVKELQGVENNGYEHCVTPFIESCDHDKDTKLSEREWCCCFANILPPCLSALKKIPSELEGGEPVIMPGVYVPQCDDDGFFKPAQCHSSIGYCWCVDRHGAELDNTRTRGTPQCEP